MYCGLYFQSVFSYIRSSSVHGKNISTSVCTTQMKKWVWFDSASGSRSGSGSASNYGSRSSGTGTSLEDVLRRPTQVTGNPYMPLASESTLIIDPYQFNGTELDGLIDEAESGEEGMHMPTVMAENFELAVRRLLAYSRNEEIYRNFVQDFNYLNGGDQQQFRSFWDATVDNPRKGSMRVVAANGDRYIVHRLLDTTCMFKNDRGAGTPYLEYYFDVRDIIPNPYQPTNFPLFRSLDDMRRHDSAEAEAATELDEVQTYYHGNADDYDDDDDDGDYDDDDDDE